MAGLETAAETLVPKLLAQDTLAATIRRIAGLAMALDEAGVVTAEVRWAWQRIA